MRVRNYRKFAPWLLLGPITGFLVAGIYRNAHRHEHILASLYGVALIVSWFDLAAWSDRAMKALNGVIQ